MPGFLSFSRASFMIDFIFIALLLVLPLIIISIRLAKKKKYKLHKLMQIAIGSSLFISVLLFEIEMRISGWSHLAEDSPYIESWVYPSLYLHLLFSIPTTFIWFYAAIKALKNFPSPPQPSSYSKNHKLIVKFAVTGMFCTSATGFLFYWLAFVA